jgi:aconitate hydratase
MPLMIFVGAIWHRQPRDCRKGNGDGRKGAIAESFERIHRSNLVGMGVLPLQFKEGQSAATLGLDGSETFGLRGLENGGVRPRQDVTLTIERTSGEMVETTVILRIDTPIEIEYYKNGGILPYVLRQLLA